ncbi:hypothetical protein E2C01_099814 [Portunus trituberculatus]|uniref:Uncharacterized protein n=1 Tax=Portunus trituberculatus TaxID=210409 RepID=A0A5B7KAI4_PORTR|nr:hypothetical protein [Portunus trituberculatus]
MVVGRRWCGGGGGVATHHAGPSLTSSLPSLRSHHGVATAAALSPTLLLLTPALSPRLINSSHVPSEAHSEPTAATYHNSGPVPSPEPGTWPHPKSPSRTHALKEAATFTQRRRPIPERVCLRGAGDATCGCLMRRHPASHTTQITTISTATIQKP